MGVVWNENALLRRVDVACDVYTQPLRRDASAPTRGRHQSSGHRSRSDLRRAESAGLYDLLEGLWVPSEPEGEACDLALPAHGHVQQLDAMGARL